MPVQGTAYQLAMRPTMLGNNSSMMCYVVYGFNRIVAALSSAAFSPANHEREQEERTTAEEG